MINTFEIIGSLGLLLITAGVLTKGRKKQDMLFIAGGVCLETYSIGIQNGIFIVLQLVFTVAAIVDFLKVSEFF